MAESVPCLVRTCECGKIYTNLKLETDQSVNGIYVNGHSLKPFTPYTLHEGDLITFGALNCLRQEYQYQFHTSCHVIGNNDTKRESLKRMDSETLIEGTADKSHATHDHTDVLTSIFNFTEKTLQCGVCGRLLVQATVLNCSHMFCKLCIFNWMQNNDACPTCQQSIISVVHVAALDGCLDNIAEQLGQRDKQQRAVAIPLPNAKKNRVCDTVIKGEKQGVRLPTCLSRHTAKHYPLATKKEHPESRMAVCKERVLNKCPVFKRTAALNKVHPIARKAIKYTRATVGEQAMVTTADAFLTGKTAAVQSVDGSMTAHRRGVIRNSSKTVIGRNESAGNITPGNVVVYENMESDSAQMTNDDDGEV